MILNNTQRAGINPEYNPRTPHIEEVVWLIVLLLISSAVSLLFFDRDVATYFRSLDQSSLVTFARNITNLGLAAWYIIIGGAVFSITRRIRSLRSWVRPTIYIIFAVAGSGIIADILKVIIGRSRPDLLFLKAQYDFGFGRFTHDLNSFPSGHSTTVGAVAVAFALLFPKYRWWFLVAGATLAATRFVTAVHFLSDVLSGFSLGAGVAILLKLYLQRRGWRL